MKRAAGFMTLLLLVLWSSCRSDFETRESDGKLQFSRDTVFLDTVFSNLSTATYSLKVYNRSKEDIHIPQISLKNGENSLYRLNVNGLPGSFFEDVEILGRDSIYIFIETTVPSEELQESEFLYVDHLQFESAAHLQEVPLVTLVKDAILLYPKKDEQGITEKIPFGTDENGEPVMVNGFYLSPENLNLTNQKPYVIYGYAAVPEGSTLIVNAGARLYFHADSGILVPKNSSLQVKGQYSPDLQKMENEVVFKGDRLQGLYRNIPGQWGGIFLQKGSKDHLFEHLTIRNAKIGILSEGTTESPTNVNLKNVQIYNSALSGLRAENSDISAENVVINNSGQSSLYLNGGNYHFKHLSIANYWQQSFRTSPALFISTTSEAGPVPLQAEFHNSIIYGNEKRELEFAIFEGAAADLLFSHCLIKFTSENASGGFYDFSNEEIYRSIWLNEDPQFVAPKERDLRLKSTSAAIDKGDPEVAGEVPQDLLGTNRTPNPDLGAYEFVEEKEE